MTESEHFRRIYRILSPIILLTFLMVLGFAAMQIASSAQVSEPKMSKIESLSYEIGVPESEIIQEFTWDFNYELYSTDEYNYKVKFGKENQVDSLVKELK